MCRGVGHLQRDCPNGIPHYHGNDRNGIGNEAQHEQETRKQSSSSENVLENEQSSHTDTGKGNRAQQTGDSRIFPTKDVSKEKVRNERKEVELEESDITQTGETGARSAETSESEYGRSASSALINAQADGVNPINLDESQSPAREVIMQQQKITQFIQKEREISSVQTESCSHEELSECESGEDGDCTLIGSEETDISIESPETPKARQRVKKRKQKSSMIAKRNDMIICD